MWGQGRIRVPLQAASPKLPVPRLRRMDISKEVKSDRHKIKQDSRTSKYITALIASRAR